VRAREGGRHWSRGDIMLINALFSGDGQSARLADRVFYWIDNDKDLAKHVGQMVEIKATACPAR
jgi:hypothetical protein